MNFIIADIRLLFGLPTGEYIYVQSDSGDVLRFDNTGVYQFTISRPQTAWTAGGPSQGADGAMLLPLWSPEDGGMLFSIDNETQSLLQQQQLPEAHIYAPGLHENDLLLLTSGLFS